MSTENTVEALKKSSFFSDFPEEHLQDLVDLSREEEYRAFELIFKESELAKDVYLITGGKVALVINVIGKGYRQIMKVSEGDLIGWSPLLERPRLSDTAKALTPVTALAIDGERLLQLCQENPKFGYEFMRRTAIVLSDRLNAVRKQLVDVHGFNLPEMVLESD